MDTNQKQITTIDRIKYYARLFLVVIILLQAVYLSYTLWFFIITAKPFPRSVKLSATLAGIAIGFLWLLKEKVTNKVIQDLQSNATETEKSLQTEEKVTLK